MNLCEEIKQYHPFYKGDIPYFIVNGFHFFYCKLKDNKEVLSVCLNKGLIHQNDLKVLNKFYKNIIKFTSDNMAFKNDMLYLQISNEYDLLEVLNEVSEKLNELNYYPKKNCVFCGCEASYQKVDKVIIPIDEKCSNRLFDEKKELIDNYNENIKKSIKYAFLAGFIGILPALLVAFILGSYSIISTLLLFICPFITTMMFYKTDIIRTTKNDVKCLYISLLFIVIYHLILIPICVIEHHITSFINYFEVLNVFFYESIIETIFVYIVGLFAGYFLIKRKPITRLNKLD